MFIEFETNRLKYKVSSDEAGMTLIDLMMQKMEISSRMVRRAKDGKSIQVNDHPMSVNGKVRINDVVTLHLEEEPNIFEPQDIPIDIVFENQDLLVVNKQPYVVVHPTKGHPNGTIGNGIAMHFEKEAFYGKIRFINRLDRDTSGLLLVAKNGYAQQIVSNQMIADTVEKKYLALVKGRVEEDFGTINLPIGRPNPNEMHRAVMADGQASVTHFEVVERYEGATLVRIRLETGRTHQIRVHFTHLGHPLIGDELYGCPSNHIERQALHSYYLRFELPRTREEVILEAELPEDIKALIALYASGGGE